MFLFSVRGRLKAAQDVVIRHVTAADIVIIIRINRRVLKKKQQNAVDSATVIESCLVVGQGGVAEDAHGAYALAKALASNGLCGEDATFYATFKRKELATCTLPVKAGEMQDAASTSPSRVLNKEDSFEQPCSTSDTDYDVAWRSDPHRGAEHNYVTEEIFEVAEVLNRTADDFLATKPDTKTPAWVGTTWYEQALPHTEMRAAGVDCQLRLTCPLVCNIAYQIEGEDDYRGTRGLYEEQNRRLVNDLRTLAPNGSWDLVIGLNHGGSSIFVGINEGEEEKRASGHSVSVSSDVLRSLVDVGGAGRYLLVVHGLCIDGDSYFEEMRRELQLASSAGAFMGCYGVDETRQWLDPVSRLFSSSKSPRIILDAIDGQLELAVGTAMDVQHPPSSAKADIDANSDEEAHAATAAARRKAASRAAARARDRRLRPLFNSADVNADGVLTVDALGSPRLVPDGGRCPLTRGPLGDFVKCAVCHRTDTAGNPFPVPWIPLAWAMMGYVFDGAVMPEVHRMQGKEPAKARGQRQGWRDGMGCIVS